jgi:hypothetical protein
MKFSLIALMAITASAHHAAAALTDPVTTETTANAALLENIQVQSDQGARQFITEFSYKKGGAVIENDTSFAIGAQASCDSLLGTIAQDLVIPMQVTSHKQNAIETGQTGDASILIQKGSRMYGACNQLQNSSGGLLETSVRFESVDPSVKFQITWAPKQVSVRCDASVQGPTETEYIDRITADLVSDVYTGEKLYPIKASSDVEGTDHLALYLRYGMFAKEDGNPEGRFLPGPGYTLDMQLVRYTGAIQTAPFNRSGPDSVLTESYETNAGTWAPLVTNLNLPTEHSYSVLCVYTVTENDPESGK